MKLNATEHYPNETGGILVGYVNEEDIVICEIIGGGDKAKHTPHNFCPDNRYQSKMLENIFYKTNNRHFYLGEWHTHPNGSSKMSYLDRRTLFRIANHSKNLQCQPIMGIIPGSPGSWNLNIRQYSRSTNNVCPIANVRNINIIYF